MNNNNWLVYLQCPVSRRLCQACPVHVCVFIFPLFLSARPRALSIINIELSKSCLNGLTLERKTWRWLQRSLIQIDNRTSKHVQTCIDFDCDRKDYTNVLGYLPNPSASCTFCTVDQGEYIVSDLGRPELSNSKAVCSRRATPRWGEVVGITTITTTHPVGQCLSLLASGTTLCVGPLIKEHLERDFI